MIRVRKPSVPPSVLIDRGVPLRDAMIAAVLGGATEFEFEADVYGHASVKSVLVVAQHGKCAFCESRFTHVAYGDVEHFRPKGSVGEVRPFDRPGYFWLAYEWRNLYASCQVCNQRHKKNAFPIRGRRASHDAPDFLAERAVLLSPGHGSPERHIEFVGSVPHGRTERGRETIRLLGLDRETLNNQRRERSETILNYLRALEQLADVPDADAPSLVRDIVTALCAWMREDAEYAAMSRCLIRAHPLAARVLAACA